MAYTTRQLLDATGLPAGTFAQWVKRDRVALTSGKPGRGNHHSLHAFEDVAQIAVILALGRLGVPLGRARLAWLIGVAPHLMFPRKPGEFAVLIAPRPDGSDHNIRVVYDDDDDGADLPDAPDSFVVLRPVLLIARLRAKLATVTDGDAR